MCHAERQEAYDWIAAHGGTPDSARDAVAEGAGGRRVTAPTTSSWTGARVASGAEPL